MSNIIEEMQAILDGKKTAEDLYLAHYGKGHLDGGHSGRYPWGSGEDAYQHGEYRDFQDRVDKMRKEGFTWTDPKDGKEYKGDTAIAKSMGLSTTEFRIELSICSSERRAKLVARAKELQEEGKGATAIGREMGIPEGTVRSLLNPHSEAKMNEAKETATFLKDKVDKAPYGMVDVGVASELQLGVSKERLNTALYLLKREGYMTYSGGIPQATNPGHQTTQKVLCVPGKKHGDIYNYDQVSSLEEYKSYDNGKTFKKSFVYPESLDSSRLKVLLRDEIGPDGEPGVAKDGVIQIRRGVPDLSLGDARYSQVRIMVDGDKYLKGMAVYSDNMPDGIDVIFNSNKTSYEKALKPVKDDPDNPFGSLIKENGGQSYYIGDDGKEHLSLINKRADEGDWTEWKDALPAQFLSKQSESMARKQLDLAREDKQAEYQNIMALTNPTIKKYYLDKFAEECDSAAIDLKAAALPGQKYHVILPINSLKETEIFAPQYDEGTKLALIRYPHGGTFEIPILTVNNKNKDAINVIGKDSIDAVGINKVVAEQLSGADFDGDTVMCIPTHDPLGKVKIASRKPFEGLKSFDPQTEYPAVPGMKYMKDEDAGTDATQSEMGKISNLITDMTLAGAKDDELERAVKHSMVVIDAAKHKLNYQQSYEDQGIEELRVKYQGKKSGGAATIISRASGQDTVEKRQGTPKVNQKDKAWYDPTRPEGALVYKQADDLYYPVRKYDKDTKTMTISTVDGKKISYNMEDKDAVARYSPVQVIDKDGKVRYQSSDGSIQYKFKARTQKSTKMAERDDAYELLSSNPTPMEILYADYANDMKRLANKARMDSVNTQNLQYNKDSKKKYEAEVRSLDDKLARAEINKLKEREAQRRTAAEMEKKISDFYDQYGTQMTSKDVKKAKQQAITKYREEVGSEDRKTRAIDITDKEWEAIQAGAISNSKLLRILNNSDPDSLRARAMPKDKVVVSQAKINKMQALQAQGKSLAQIAKACGVSTSTVNKYLKGAV